MKKLLSFLICTALILSIIPTAVFAAGKQAVNAGIISLGAIIPRPQRLQ